MTDTPTDERRRRPTNAATRPWARLRAGRAEPIPFWQRRSSSGSSCRSCCRSRSIVGLVAYVLNISRMFLSGHGHIPIIVGSVIT